jgi:hypothetical protein
MGKRDRIGGINGNYNSQFWLAGANEHRFGQRWRNSN